MFLFIIYDFNNPPDIAAECVESMWNVRTLCGMCGLCMETPPGIPGILVVKCQDSTRTPPGIAGILVGKYQDSTRNPGRKVPGLHQDSTELEDRVNIHTVMWWWPEQPPKTSGDTCFQVVWVVVVRGGPNHQKQVVTLIFSVCGWCWWPEEGPTTETSVTACFRCVWVVVVAKGGPTTENEWLRSFSAGVGGGGSQRKAQLATTENEQWHSFSGGMGGGGGQRN